MNPLRSVEPGRSAPIQAPDAAPAQGRRLLILAHLPALRNAQGHWMLPAKFVSGMKAYARQWPGPVAVGLQAGSAPTSDLDNRFWSPDELPFELHTVAFSELAAHGGPLLEDAVVLVTLHHHLHGLGKRCLEQGAIFVAHTELSLATQLQIARFTHGWGLRLAKSGTWLLLNHRRALQEIRIARGLQCNGTPAFDAFARHNAAPLLYFDNRTTSAQCATSADIDRRFEALSRRGHLRLLFSGRLHPIKGVDSLVPMARRLRDRGVAFDLAIAGDGPLRESLKARIAREGLQAQVRLLGTLDFEHELMPLLRHEVDLFVCPHLQGDPSCTYLETLCAGVPIVGYANEAWRGLHRLSLAGRLSPPNRPHALADEIAALASDFAALRELADRARAFAAERVFESEFDRRIDHLKRLCAAEQAPP